MLIEEAENRLRPAARIISTPRSCRAEESAGICDRAGTSDVRWIGAPAAESDQLAEAGVQSQVIELLEQVRVARNELMHFATDPLSAGQEAAVHGLLQVLRTAEPNP
ncbi:hypothetical protein FEK33_29570 [Nocardia asteroides NBRC 15531]|uniref:hypothetical protein n=1 Tax=Nocardia asteroides TaxID=1824 RepID=UPI000F81888E|nr:hypothetical protein [Nocardia asteroides]TLF62590.1 hypothetical protein FEK33_29570 [Nocardia asteroides NBRC 15531]UGT46815.1 hypothetical protein LT345_19985 [Nocardia asteroides]